MPGFILHLTSAKMLLNQLPDHPHFPYMIASENDFMTGSLPVSYTHLTLPTILRV